MTDEPPRPPKRALLEAAAAVQTAANKLSWATWWNDEARLKAADGAARLAAVAAWLEAVAGVE